MSRYHVNAVINTSSGAEITMPFDVELAEEREEAEAMVRELLNIMNIDDTRIMYIECSKIKE